MNHRISLSVTIAVLAGVLMVNRTAAAGTPPPTQSILVGLLTEQGTGRCKNRSDVEWTDLHYEVGFGYIDKAAKGVDLKSLQGKLVAVSGFPGAGRPELAALAGQTPCGIEQMRSDWIYSKTGMRMFRGAPPVGHFEVMGAVAWDGLSAKVEGDQLVVTVANRFPGLNVQPESLQALQIVVHYLGTRGKPGSHDESKAVGTVVAGKSSKVSFPLGILDKDPSSGAVKGRRPGEEWDFKAQSILVRAHSVNATFDVDVPLRVLGVEVP